MGPPREGAITVLLRSVLDVADTCTHVTDIESTLCLSGGESLTRSEVVHDSTLLSSFV